jgi:phage-related protein
MEKPTIIFYGEKNHAPVKQFLDNLNSNTRAKLLKIINYVENYGVNSVPKYTKKLTGTNLWEIRTLGKVNARIIYSTSKNNTIILLHGFIKKSQKTPKNDLEIAKYRLKKYKEDID